MNTIILLASLLLSVDEPAKALTDITPTEGDFTFQMTFRHEGYFEPGVTWPTGLAACYGTGYWEGWRLYIHGPDEKALFQIGIPEGAGGATSLETTMPVSRGQWHRLALTWRSTDDGLGMMRIHLDGEFVASLKGVPAPIILTDQHLDKTIVLGNAGMGLGALKLEVASVDYSPTALDDQAIHAAYLADANCATNPAEEANPLLEQVYTRALKLLADTEDAVSEKEPSGERKVVTGCTVRPIADFADEGDGVRSLAVELPADLAGVMLYAKMDDGSYRRLNCARWPKAEGIYADATCEDWTLRFADPDAPKIVAGKRILLHGYWQYFWQDQFLPAETRDDGAFKLLKEHMYGFGKTPIASIVNAREVMSEHGEWCYEDGKLLIRPLDGMAAVTIPNRPNQLAWYGNCEKLRIADTDFSDTLGVGLEVADATDVEIVNCTFRRIGREGLILRHCKNVVIKDCSFDEIGLTALSVLSLGLRDTLESGNLLVQRCEFSNSGRLQSTYTPGIYIEGCGAVVRDCLFHDIPSSGIRIEGNEIVVRDCRFMRTVTESDDQGSIDMWGNPSYRNCVFFNNYFGTVGGNGKCACGRAGIRFDDMISGMAVISNVFDRCSEGIFGGVQIHAGHYNALVGNSFYRVGKMVTITRWGDQRWREMLDSGETKARTRDLESSDLYRERYPELKRLHEDHCLEYLKDNTFSEKPLKDGSGCLSLHLSSTNSWISENRICEVTRR